MKLESPPKSRHPSPAIVLSHFQTRPLLDARRAGQARCRISPDLGIRNETVELSDAGIRFEGGEELVWKTIEKITRTENGCFRIEGRRAAKITAFSDLTDRPCSLMPTEAAPTMLISGTLMHRIKGIDPIRDTEEKIRAVQPVGGRVLDTATGLGYTAMAAARTAARVVTVEFDPAAHEIARQNPWSRGLFENPKIDRRMGDSFDVIQEFEPNSFDCIIHDPPVLALAGHLYSLAFYREMARVLRERGRLFHYVGNPDSRTGAKTTQGVIRRLKEAGFSRVTRKPRAFGVAAIA
jgi:predicted methyltransferase